LQIAVQALRSTICNLQFVIRGFAVLDDTAIAEFAAAHTTSVAAVRALIELVRAQVGATQFYIFWTSGGRGGAGGTGRSRTLLAFRTPDAALAFAQRNHLASPAERPRLRRLTLLQLFHAMLQEPAIAALIVAAEAEIQPSAAGQIPTDLRLERSELVRRLRETGETVI
jgi:hypothetical protein